MESVFVGDVLKLRIYGESHSESIGIFVEGLPSELNINEDAMSKFMRRRAPGKNKWSTPRLEKDEVIIDINDGIFHGFINNTNIRPQDYNDVRTVPRPGHADYASYLKYGIIPSGGGIFSGRMTAPLCIIGSIAMEELRKRGVEVAAHIKRIGTIEDDSYYNYDPRSSIFKDKLVEVCNKDFPTISDERGEEMKALIEDSVIKLDSVGGVIETLVYGMVPCVGGPLFDGLEAKIARLVYSVPAVKGIEFGKGFELTYVSGSESNDEFIFDDDEVVLETNNAGGILGGISVGSRVAPICFDVAIKPTPSIGRKQRSVDLVNMVSTELEVKGRHDPCIVPRAVPVIEATTAIALYDSILAMEREL